MPGRFAAPLPKTLKLLERQIIASEIEQTIEQHRTVTCRKYESVPVEPLRILRIKFEELGPQCKGHGRRAHGQARMAGVRILHGVGRKESNGIDTQFFQRLRLDYRLRLRGGHGIFSPRMTISRRSCDARTLTANSRPGLLPSVHIVGTAKPFLRFLVELFR